MRHIAMYRGGPPSCSKDPKILAKGADPVITRRHLARPFASGKSWATQVQRQTVHIFLFDFIRTIYWGYWGHRVGKEGGRGR